MINIRLFSLSQNILKDYFFLSVLNLPTKTQKIISLDIVSELKICDVVGKNTFKNDLTINNWHLILLMLTKLLLTEHLTKMAELF